MGSAQSCCAPADAADVADVAVEEALPPLTATTLSLPKHPALPAEPCPESAETLGSPGSPDRASPKAALEKMMSGSHTEVDYEIMRGIALHRALQRSEFWTSPDEIRRTHRVAEVWRLSTPVDRFDIFLSHTWRCKGRWKVLALVLQSGWLHGLLASFLGTAVTLSLRATELIEDPWHNVLLLLDNTQFASPLSFWTVLISGLSMVLGLCLSPLLPFKTQMCYLDAACIHLGQGELFERGIYSIAGSFSVAEEMRVLYSEQYLSSLWCLFELVGYHKANPEGRLVFKPLFIERSAAICTFFIWCFAFSINFAVTYTAEGFRQEYIGVMYLVTFLLPLILLVHFMRRNYREKARLIFDLKNFELDRTTCASEFDRSFILSAIEAWYGTRENFQNYVRGPLREQLLQLFPSPHLPCSYVALILCSMMAYSLDIGLSIYKAGASMKVIMKQLLCTFTFFGIWFWAAFNGIFYLSDRTAGKDATGQHRWKCLCDCGRTFLVALAIFLWTLVGFAVMIACIRSTNLVFACCYIIFSMLIPCCILDVFKVCRRRPQQDQPLATSSL